MVEQCKVLPQHVADWVDGVYCARDRALEG